MSNNVPNIPDEAEMIQLAWAFINATGGFATPRETRDPLVWRALFVLYFRELGRDIKDVGWRFGVKAKTVRQWLLGKSVPSPSRRGPILSMMNDPEWQRFPPEKIREVMVELAKRRAQKLSKARRSEIARQAALARHGALSAKERSDEARSRWEKRRGSREKRTNPVRPVSK